MTEARRHHYVSQCYLKGFTDGRSKKSKLLVYDREARKVFATKPSNVASERDFNRIDWEGDPNVLEKMLANFEGDADRSLRRLDDGAPFEGQDRENILQLVALFAIRTPRLREAWRRAQTQLAEHVMELALSSREMWESQVDQARENGVEFPGGTSYEEVKAFFDSKQYTIEVARERHIHLEFHAISAVLPLLFERKWWLLRATSESGPFITSDLPVSITWDEPEKIPAPMRLSPGYAMKRTSVTFPVSQDLALLGAFEIDDIPGPVPAATQMVHAINGTSIGFAQRQMYAPKRQFSYIDGNHQVGDGRQLERDL